MQKYWESDADWIGTKSFLYIVCFDIILHRHGLLLYTAFNTIITVNSDCTKLRKKTVFTN